MVLLVEPELLKTQPEYGGQAISPCIVMEGAFPHPCEVCGSCPTALVVEIGEDDFEALHKIGEVALPERHYFCADHAAEAGTAGARALR